MMLAMERDGEERDRVRVNCQRLPDAPAGNQV